MTELTLNANVDHNFNKVLLLKYINEILNYYFVEPILTLHTILMSIKKL